MKDTLKPYPAYIDSSVPWLGEVPEHWALQRLDRLFILRSESPLEGDPRVMGYLDGRVTLRSNVIGQKIKGVVKEGGWQRVHPGDFAISGMNAHLGGMGVSDSLGKCSPIYLVLKPKDGTNAQFVSHTVRRAAHSGALKALVNTIRFNSADFKRDELKRIWVCLPTNNEQAAIVRYIDYMDRRIRRYISAKKKLIALLNEQKQAIIHQTVTRGLDPNVCLKPSGVEWLGEVPEHWEVKPLKRWAKINQDTLPENTDPDYEFAYFDIGSVGTGFLVKQLERMRFGNAPSRARRILHKNDTIVSTVRTYLKSVYFISEGIPDLIASTGFAVLTPESELVPEYFSLVIQDGSFVDRVTANSTGVAYPAIAETRLASLQLAIPSAEVEQQAITKYVLRETMPFNTAITRAQREIDLLREYHTRLVADIVTGKLDVRAAAAGLPEKAEEEPDAFGEAEALNDSETTTEDDEELPMGAINDN